MAYPNYMRKQRRSDITPDEMNAADQIRRRLMAIANRRGYGVRYYTDERGRQMASIGRLDGVGVGFMMRAEQVAALIAANCNNA